jgi:hypothetical protein
MLSRGAARQKKEEDEQLGAASSLSPHTQTNIGPIINHNSERATMPTRKRAARQQAALTNLLFLLPNDILERVMELLVLLHARPKALICFLLTTKQLCKPRFKMYKTVVKPFLIVYLRRLEHDKEKICPRGKMQIFRLPPSGPLLASAPRPANLEKAWALQEHINLVDKFLWVIWLPDLALASLRSSTS